MSRFSDYIQKTFSFSSWEADEIIAAMIKPIGKSIRINTRKITLENFKLHAKEQWWALTETDIPEVFLIDRDDTTIALGNTIEHVAGWFYIQEVAAAHPPYLLKKHIANHPDKILDMCASPGGKTTQLADYFPDSLIIANEVNRTRTPQLFDNLDRMGYDNIAVVSCDGRFFQNFPDFFDAVLLDAPCSGEGTAFRDSSIVDHWHEKNIDRIAKLQKQLMETAEAVTAPGGTLSYSTCTLNKEENERVIESAIYNLQSTMVEDKKNSQIDNWRLIIEDWSLQKNMVMLFCYCFCPHIEHTGGFFASIFQKKNTSQAEHDYPVLAAQGQKNLIVTPATKGEREIVERFIAKHLKSTLKNGFLYVTKDGVYFNQRNLGPLAEYFFFVHAGTKIGTIKGNTFTPIHHLWWCLDKTDEILHITIKNQDWSSILQGKHPQYSSFVDGWYVGDFWKGTIGLCSVKEGNLYIPRS